MKTNDLEKIATKLILTNIGAKPKQQLKKQKIHRLTSDPAIKREIEQITKTLSNLPPSMQKELAKEFVAIGESKHGFIAEGFDSVEDRDNWITKNKKKFSQIWIMDTLKESESSKESARLLLEHHIESGVDLNTAVASVLKSSVIMPKHLKSALKEMHMEGLIDINELSVRL